MFWPCRVSCISWTWSGNLTDHACSKHSFIHALVVALRRRVLPFLCHDGVNLLTLLLAAVQPILSRFGNVRDVYSLVLPCRLHQTDLGVSNHLVQILLRVRPPAAEGGRPQPNFAAAILSQVQYPVFLFQLINVRRASARCLSATGCIPRLAVAFSPTGTSATAACLVRRVATVRTAFHCHALLLLRKTATLCAADRSGKPACHFDVAFYVTRASIATNRALERRGSS